MQRLFLKNNQIVTVDAITDINFGVLFVLKFFRERERESNPKTRIFYCL